MDTFICPVSDLFNNNEIDAGCHQNKVETVKMKGESKLKIYEKCWQEINEAIRGKQTLEKMEKICSVLKENIPYYFWVGFYIPEKDFLELGPFKGPPACAQISFTGVCGRAAKNKKAVIVPNVHKFPGHIQCDPRSNSEIALPVFDKKGSMIAVLDVDSESLESFDEIDREWLEKITKNVFST